MDNALVIRKRFELLSQTMLIINVLLLLLSLLLLLTINTARTYSPIISIETNKHYLHVSQYTRSQLVI